MPQAVFIPAQLNDLAVDVLLSGVAQGDLFYRGASKWNNLPHGISGQPLLTQGAAADPLWGALNLAGGSSIVTGVLPAANVDLSGDVILAPATSARNVIVPTADGAIPLTVKAHSITQGADLFEAQWSDGTVLTAIGPTGLVTIKPQADALGIFRITNAAGTGGAGGLGEYVRVNSAPDINNLGSVTFDSPALMLPLAQRYSTVKAVATVLDSAPTAGSGFAAMDLSGRYGSSGTLANLYGIYSGCRLTGTGIVTTLSGIEIDIRATGVGSTVTTGQGLRVLSPVLSGAGTTIPTFYGIVIQTIGRSGITNAAGIRIEAQNGAATLNYALWSLGGQSLLLTGAAATKALVLQGFSGQSANYFEIQDSTNAILMDWTAAGNLEMRRTSSTTGGRLVGTITGEFNSNTDATYTGRLKFSATDASGTREGLRIEGDGANPLVGIGGAVTAGILLTINGVVTCPGAGSGSERFGAGTLAAGTNATALGRNASASNTSCVAIGDTALASQSQSIAIGLNSIASGTNSVAIGNNAKAQNSGAFALGPNTVAKGTGTTAIGNGTMVGVDGVSTSASSTAIGASAACVAVGGNSTCIGSSASDAGFGPVLCLGNLATATANNQGVIGSTNSPIIDIYLGRGVVSTAAAGVTLNATGGSGADKTGGALTLAGGKSTGAGLGGDIIFQSTIAAGSSSTLNTLQEKMRLSNVGVLSFSQPSTVQDRTAHDITPTFVTATDASRKARAVFNIWDTAAREALRVEANGSAAMLGVLGAAAIARPASYTLAGSATRVFPTDPSSSYTGLDNTQVGAVYASVANLNTLRGAVSSLEGLVRQLIVDLASTSGYGFLVAS